MIYNVTFLIHNQTRCAISYGRTAREAEIRTVKQAAKVFHVDESQVKVEKTIKCKMKT